MDGAQRWDAAWRPGEPPSARRAWCYQTVGVAAVLYDRARLDGDEALRALATEASPRCSTSATTREQSWDAALCHGRSGVGAVAWHFADDPRLAAYAARLARRVLAEYDAGCRWATGPSTCATAARRTGRTSSTRRWVSRSF